MLEGVADRQATLGDATVDMCLQQWTGAHPWAKSRTLAKSIAEFSKQLEELPMATARPSAMKRVRQNPAAVAASGGATRTLIAASSQAAASGSAITTSAGSQVVRFRGEKRREYSLGKEDTPTSDCVSSEEKNEFVEDSQF